MSYEELEKELDHREQYAGKNYRKIHYIMNYRKSSINRYEIISNNSPQSKSSWGNFATRSLPYNFYRKQFTTINFTADIHHKQINAKHSPKSFNVVQLFEGFLFQEGSREKFHRKI
jgi:hypothetical protein